MCAINLIYELITVNIFTASLSRDGNLCKSAFKKQNLIPQLHTRDLNPPFTQ